MEPFEKFKATADSRCFPVVIMGKSIKVQQQQYLNIFFIFHDIISVFGCRTQLTALRLLLTDHKNMLQEQRPSLPPRGSRMESFVQSRR